MPASVTRARTLVRTIFDGDQARAISRKEPAMLSPTKPFLATGCATRSAATSS